MKDSLNTSCADKLAEVLARSGISYAFGLPGGEIAAFMDSCRRANIRVVLTGHESSAALIAQVMGQITGIPGLCFATLGPGATNLVTGVANSFLERSPLVAVTAQIPVASYRTMTHQRLATEKMFAPITKRSSVVGNNAYELLQDLLCLATSPRPGPVMLVLPSDVATQECAGGTSTAPKSQGTEFDRSRLDEITEMIKESERPLIIFGIGVPINAAPVMRHLVDTIQVPFVVTAKAKGILSEDHPLFLGVASGMAIDRDILETIRSADLLIGIGFDPVEVDKTWFSEMRVASLDSISMAEGDYHPFEVIGDLAVVVTTLSESLTDTCAWPEDLIASRRQAITRTPTSSKTGVSPLALIEGLRSVFPRNGIVSCDVGSHKLMMGQFWKTYEPGTFFMSNGLSGMGFGIPAAIAGQLAYPDRAVLTVLGDGGMLMMVHDLALIRELKLPIVMIVLVDSSLSLIRISQQRRGYVPCGVDFIAPDFAAIARAFGIQGERASSLAAAKLSVERAVEQRTALLLEVPVDMQEYYELV